MKNIIFVKLLNEGTEVYRPVLSRIIKGNVYEVGGFEIHNVEDETWEFLPGTHVFVEEKKLQEGLCLVATKRI
jgi:hypothetical protein